jgi:hypothetical protein
MSQDAFPTALVRKGIAVFSVHQAVCPAPGEIALGKGEQLSMESDDVGLDVQ